jgi:hypothetical protein
MLSFDGLSLRAPIAVPVEVRAPSGRVFRLAWNAGEDGVRLERPAPFEPGRTVDVRMALPDGEGTFELAARLLTDDDERAVELVFLDPPEAAREALRRYVIRRLGLPETVPAI